MLIIINIVPLLGRAKNVTLVHIAYTDWRVFKCQSEDEIISIVKCKIFEIMSVIEIK